MLSFTKSQLDYAYRALAVAGTLFDAPHRSHGLKELGAGAQTLKSPNSPTAEATPETLGSAFAWLASLEEEKVAARDDWGRFPFQQSRLASLADRGLKVPPVNQCLLEVLNSGSGVIEKPAAFKDHAHKWFGDKEFCIALTHDIDILAQWTARGLGRTLKDFISNLGRGHRLKARAYGKALLSAPGDMLTGYDPFSNLKEIAGRERALGFNSTFYFLFDHKHALDGPEVKTYEKLLPKAVDDVLREGCEVGVHGSTLAAESLEQLEIERARCQTLTGNSEIGIRFHNLRLNVPSSFDLIEKAGFSYDTTLGFAEYPGWRNGFTYPYRPYNLREDRAYNFIEIPLVIMDATFSQERYLNMPQETAKKKIFEILDTFKLWRGAGAICWHNSMFDSNLSLGYGQLYWDILKWIAENNGIGVSAKSLIKEWKQRELMVQE